MPRRAALIVIGVFSFWLIPGCAVNTELTRYQSRVVPDAEADALLDAAGRILRREFGPLEFEREARRIMSASRTYTTARDSGTARDLYGGRTNMRKVAHFSVGRRGDALTARLRIDVEREDTRRASMLQPTPGRFGDGPSFTPIQQDAATTHEQNTVWTIVRRDRQLERALLEELVETFAPPVETADPGVDTVEPAPG